MSERDAVEEGVELLRQLGLNQLESEVYTFLLPRQPMTAYRIGKHLGRPTANVYKAIEALARHGAVLVEEGKGRLCRAVPVAEFLGHSLRGYQETVRRTQEALSQLEDDTFDERVYRLESVPEVLERAIDMLARCNTVAVVDAFPNALDALAPHIRQAVDRGLDVFVECYAPIDLPGASVALVPQGEATLAAWRSEQLNLVVDGQEVMAALFSVDLSRVFQAMWTQSVYFSCLLHGGMSSEHTVVRLRQALEAGASGDELAETVRQHRFFRDRAVPGHRELLRRFSDPESL